MRSARNLLKSDFDFAYIERSKADQAMVCGAQIICLCHLNDDKLHAAGQMLDIRLRYTDTEKMLAGKQIV